MNFTLKYIIWTFAQKFNKCKFSKSDPLKTAKQVLDLLKKNLKCLASWVQVPIFSEKQISPKFQYIHNALTINIE
jgi:hypothetical protein